MTTGAPSGDGAGSHRTVPERQGWRDLLVGADTPLVTPCAVQVEGDRAGAVHTEGLVGTSGETGGGAVLRMREAHATMLVADLGRVVMGRVEIGVRCPNRAPVRVAYAEFRQFLRPDGDGMGRPFGTDAHPWSRVDVFGPHPGRAQLHSPGKRELRYVAITLDGPGEVVIDFIRVRQTTYPVRYDGHFLCSDDLLNRAWYHSAHTGDLATVTEDGSPWMLTVTFDRVLFMGDLHLQALAGYYQSSDHHWLVRNTLRQFVRVQHVDGSFPAASSHLVPWVPDEEREPSGWPPDAPDPDAVLGTLGRTSLYHDLRIDSFTAFWVAALADHLRYTGDAGFARSVLPAARRAVAFLAGRTDGRGLYTEPPDRRTDPDAEFVWVANWSPSEIATGADSFGNAVFHAALEGLALLEEEVGDGPVAAAALRRLAADVRTALVEHLWDAQTGAMILNDRDPLRDHTGDANAGNLMFGTLDAGRAAAAMAFLGDRLATPYGSRTSEYSANPYRKQAVIGYLNAMEALGRVRYGDGPGAIDLIRRWWGHMLGIGPGTGWYSSAPDGSLRRGDFANSSWTTALPALSEGVLGVRPLAPGFRRWAVAPQPGDLEWAQGRVPVPGGGIAVRWERRAGAFRMTVAADRGLGEVAVPLLGAPRTIEQDGRVVWNPERALDGTDAVRHGDTVVFRGIRGNHTWSW